MALIMGSGIRSPMRVQGWLNNSEDKQTDMLCSMLLEIVPR